MDNKGFSLIEMIVVMALIAILSTIGFPAYRNYQARARRTQGFTLLNGYYTSAHAAHAEFGWYPGNLVQTDYQPTGMLHYRLQVSDGKDAPIALNDNACINTAQNCNCAGGCPSFKVWTEGPAPGVIGATIGPYPVLNACAGLAPISVNDHNFSIRVAAVINLSATVRDSIGIDQSKTIVVCSDGSK